MYSISKIFTIVLFIEKYHLGWFQNILQDDTANAQKPIHIILIIADDLGFNDVSFRGSRQIPTPNIDALAYSGIILNNYYVSPICTPSRSALFSGIHPIHTGMQHDVIYGATPYGLPLNVKLLPEYLKDLDYTTHLVGKWHLGHFRKAYTPTCRGFDTHYGHWTGHKDYYDNTAEETNPEAVGYDMRRNMKVSYENFGNYTTDLYTEEAMKLIKQHNPSVPLFLTVSHTAVHSANPYAYLQAPDQVIQQFAYIKDPERRKYAAMVHKLDESCGLIVKTLHDYGLLENSIIVFTTDNGGPAAGFNNNAASNWPLRSVKNTLWEGGVRGAGIIWSPLLSNTSRVFYDIIHIQDWLPTLLDAIGQGSKIPPGVDGISQWDSLNMGQPSRRSEVLHNIDDKYGNLAIRVGDWKLLHGTTYNGKWDGWYGPSGVEAKEFVQMNTTIDTLFHSAMNSMAGIAFQEVLPNAVENSHSMTEILKEAIVICRKPNINTESNPCNLTAGESCLFNIKIDPCERNNVASDYPGIVKLLYKKLDKYREGMVPPLNKPKDSRGQPKFWDYKWTNWMDYIEPLPSSTMC